MNEQLPFKRCGRNVTIFPTAKIVSPENIEIGDQSMIDDFCFLYGVGAGIEIGRFCHITVHGILHGGGRLVMGDFSAVGPRCTILAATDDYHGEGFIGLKALDKYRKTAFRDVIIGSHVHIGTGATILPGVTIGDGCSIGAGSLVTKSLPEWTICYGSPCKPIKDKPREKQLAMEKEFLAEYESIKVSICCLTYNHKEFIRQALDGFLMQRTSFMFEILVHDDASTDGTTEILREYERRYPGIVKPIFQTENQYRKTGEYPVLNLYKAAQGKYIAECDGDDYWMDPLKLQKQVDFLEANPDYAMCHHDYQILQDGRFKAPSEREQPRDYSALDLIGYTVGGYGIGHCTRMWRNIYGAATRPDCEIFAGDYALNVLMGMHGKCKYIAGIKPSVYRRRHGGNSWCSLPPNIMQTRTQAMHKRIYDAMVEKGNPRYIAIRKGFLEGGAQCR